MTGIVQAYPRNNDKQPRWQVIVDQILQGIPLKLQLKASDRVVGNVQPVEDLVLSIEGNDLNAVVQDGVTLRVVVGNQVGGVLHLFKAISVARHGELADLSKGNTIASGSLTAPVQIRASK